MTSVHTEGKDKVMIELTFIYTVRISLWNERNNDKGITLKTKTSYCKILFVENARTELIFSSHKFHRNTPSKSALKPFAYNNEWFSYKIHFGLVCWMSKAEGYYVVPFSKVSDHFAIDWQILSSVSFWFWQAH